MMDYASTQAQAKGVASTSSRDECHTEAATTRTPKASPPPTVDGVDKMYRQMVEICAITSAQIPECIF
jgi:hypothetical protein